MYGSVRRPNRSDSARSRGDLGYWEDVVRLSWSGDQAKHAEVDYLAMAKQLVSTDFRCFAGVTSDRERASPVSTMRPRAGIA